MAIRVKRGSLYEGSGAEAVNSLLPLLRRVSPAEEEIRHQCHPAPLQHCDDQLNDSEAHSNRSTNIHTLSFPVCVRTNTSVLLLHALDGWQVQSRDFRPFLFRIKALL